MTSLRVLLAEIALLRPLFFSTSTMLSQRIIAIARGRALSSHRVALAPTLARGWYTALHPSVQSNRD